MGLLRTAARASVAARVVGNVHRRQHKRWAAEDAAAAPAGQLPAAPPAAPPAPAAHAAPAVPAAPPAPAGAAHTQALIDQLRQLGELRDSGILTEEEFAAQKQRLLSGA